MTDPSFRIERDSMGEMNVPKNAYYGAQTQRAVENFPISGWRFPRNFIYSIALIKRAAAQTNEALKILDGPHSQAIQQAAQEVMEGRFDNEFVVDIFQTGSGTSTNMNANEVIANRANELKGKPRGSNAPVHPNDHVNRGQSSNDVIPSTIHISGRIGLERDLIPQVERLKEVLSEKGRAFHNVLKIGRTHLQDATPIRLGQEFSGYSYQVERCLSFLKEASSVLSELALGGTAVGTGINTHPEFSRRTIAIISRETDIDFKETPNHFAAQGGQESVVRAGSALKTLSVALMKIAHDLRLMGSGPRCGIGELHIPEVQPGSSIMPGKVNPVIAESVAQVAVHVMGLELTLTLGGQWGHFELNTMLPIMGYHLLSGIHLLSRAIQNLVDQCLVGLEADQKKCESLVRESLAMATPLAPEIGYEAAAKIAKKAYQQGKTIEEVVSEEKILDPKRVKEVLDPWKMTSPD